MNLRRYVDFRGYVEGALHLRTLHDDAQIKHAFEQFDVGGNGIISKAELISYVAFWVSTYRREALVSIEANRAHASWADALLHQIANDELVSCMMGIALGSTILVVVVNPGATRTQVDIGREQIVSLAEWLVAYTGA